MLDYNAFTHIDTYICLCVYLFLQYPSILSFYYCSNNSVGNNAARVTINLQLSNGHFKTPVDVTKRENK